MMDVDDQHQQNIKSELINLSHSTRHTWTWTFWWKNRPFKSVKSLLKDTEWVSIWINLHVALGDAIGNNLVLLLPMLTNPTAINLLIYTDFYGNIEMMFAMLRTSYWMRLLWEAIAGVGGRAGRLFLNIGCGHMSKSMIFIFQASLISFRRMSAISKHRLLFNP